MAPIQSDFEVPMNQIEQKGMVEALVAKGIQQTEAELVIASRKSAFNKALREKMEQKTLACTF